MRPKASNDRRDVTASILRDLGKGPKLPALEDDVDFFTDPSDDPTVVEDLDYRSDRPVPTTRPQFLRLHPETAQELATAIARSLHLHSQTVHELAKAVALQVELQPSTIDHITASLYNRFERNMADLVEQNTKQAGGNVECSECADGDERFVHPSGDMSTEAVRVFMGWKDRSTLYSRKKLGKMPPPLSAQPPLMYDPHVIALLKYRGIVFPKARYDRDTHRALLPTVEAERAKKRRAFHEKQSAMMARENRRRAAERANGLGTTHQPATKARSSKSTVRRETTKKKR
jgi:hypothetical protein